MGPPLSRLVIEVAPKFLRHETPTLLRFAVILDILLHNELAGLARHLSERHHFAHRVHKAKSIFHFRRLLLKNCSLNSFEIWLNIARLSHEYPRFEIFHLSYL